MTLMGFLLAILMAGAPPLGLFLTLVALVVYGFRGNEWYVSTFLKRGYVLL